MRSDNSTDPRLVPLRAEITRVIRRIDDLEWEGKFKDADMGKYYLEHLKELEAQGEVYYPLF